MKKLLSVVLALALLAGMTALAGAEEAPVTITIMNYLGNQVKLDAWQKILDGYTALHPNVTFDSQSYSQNDYISLLPTRIANGDTPDIMINEMQMNLSHAITDGRNAHLWSSPYTMKMSYKKWNAAMLISEKPLRASIRL